ncbi:hypothetical protein HYR69_05865 [Candidatus Sumerlaeota bacterium]|nr:hypothetical protein [Candidatus Sumerlaeota bacterium]
MTKTKTSGGKLVWLGFAAYFISTALGGCGGSAPSGESKSAKGSRLEAKAPEKQAVKAEAPLPEASNPTHNSDTGTSATSVEIPAGGPGDVAGWVKFSGERPSRKVIPMDADSKCVAIHKGAKVGTEDAIVSKSGMVANVFVYVKHGLEGKKFEPPSAPASMDQTGCMYVPHVQGVIVEQKFNVVNSDPTLHNIHCLGEKNPQFNLSQPSPGTQEKVFHRPEIGMKFKCDVHPWMNAYVHVMEHPYFAVTGANWVFQIKGLPPGDYTIEAWHEKFGTIEKTITVGSAAISDANFTFEPPKKR